MSLRGEAFSHGSCAEWGIILASSHKILRHLFSAVATRCLSNVSRHGRRTININRRITSFDFRHITVSHKEKVLGGEKNPTALHLVIITCLFMKMEDDKSIPACESEAE